MICIQSHRKWDARNTITRIRHEYTTDDHICMYEYFEQYCSASEFCHLPLKPSKTSIPVFKHMQPHRPSFCPIANCY